MGAEMFKTRLLLGAVTALALSVGTAHAGSFLFTDDADWDLGSYASTNSGPPGADDQIQLNPNTTTTFNHIWVAASGRDTAVRIDTNTGVVLGEYLTRPAGMGGNPSRTTVDNNGDVWIGNRNESGGGMGSVVKISASATNPAIGPPINTSTGLGDIRAWTNAAGADTNGGTSTAQDTAILQYVRTSSSGIRTVAIDANNDVWVGGLTHPSYHDKIDGTSGAILNAAFQLKNQAGTTTAIGGYGGLVDGNGILWSSDWSNAQIGRYDTVNNVALSAVATGGASYGLGVDSQGNIWNSHYTANTITKHDSNGNIIATYGTGGAQTFTGEGSRGVTVTPDDNIWIANTGSNTVTRLSNTGLLLATIPVGSRPTGVSVDSNGKVWVTNTGSSTVSRIDPTAGSGAVDLTVNLGAGANPYNYSDMTGSVVQGVTNPTGTWLKTIDSGILGTMWDKVFWNTEAEGTIPTGTTITIEVRAADTLAGLLGAGWTSYLSGSMLSLLGQYAEVKATLTRTGSGPTAFEPILSDLELTTVSVPEPATLSLFAIGGLALFGLGRRRRNAA